MTSALFDYSASLIRTSCRLAHSHKEIEITINTFDNPMLLLSSVLSITSSIASSIKLFQAPFLTNRSLHWLNPRSEAHHFFPSLLYRLILFPWNLLYSAIYHLVCAYCMLIFLRKAFCLNNPLTWSVLGLF